jgi:hypothetical protein
MSWCENTVESTQLIATQGQEKARQSDENAFWLIISGAMYPWALAPVQYAIHLGRMLQLYPNPNRPKAFSQDIYRRSKRSSPKRLIAHLKTPSTTPSECLDRREEDTKDRRDG